MTVPASNQMPQLPAHLQGFNGGELSAAAAAGITGLGHSKISIKQNRFRLIDAQGQEYVVPQIYLDVIFVGANPNVSKVFYKAAFDPNAADYGAPDCYSDNGVAPSESASQPQCANCSQCPHAARGSKISPTGTALKSCADYKKLAVVLADNPSGEVYELRLPIMSMINFKNMVDSVRGTALAALVVRLSFDAQQNYPCLIFQPQAYITAEQKAAVLEVLDGEEANQAVNKFDRPRNQNLPLAAPASLPVSVPAPTVLAAQNPYQPGLQQSVAPQFNPTAPVFGAPTPQTPFMPSTTSQPPYQAPYQAPADPMTAQATPAAQTPMQEPPKRIRRTKAQMAEAAGATQAFPQTTATPRFNPAPMQPQAAPDVPGAQPAAASASLNPPVTDAALDALLGQAMRR